MGRSLEPPTPKQALLSALEAHAPADAVAWLHAGMASAAAERSRDAIGPLFAAAMRRLGREPLDAAAPLSTACGPLVAALWRRGDAGRASLLIAATEAAQAGWEDLVTWLFRQGDEDERAAVIRSLCLLPKPCSLLTLALEAGRTNSMTYYAALALDNPYAAACYDDHAFNHVVLKCLFNGLPIERVIGLRRRANPELTGMCENYIGERLAAGRAVPADIWLALEPHAGASGMALMSSHLDHPDADHRRYAALALSRRRSDPGVGAALAARLAVETDPAVRAAIGTSARSRSTRRKRTRWPSPRR
jgi:hypothetical protein